MTKLVLDSGSSSGSGSVGDPACPAIEWELLKVRWFHPHINRNTAVHILLGTNKIGSYLLRVYSKGGPDDLTVSVRFPNDVKHFTVTWKGDGYVFGQHKFDNLHKLLEHFDNMPVIGSSDDMGLGGTSSVVLKYPYPRDLDDEGMYNAVATHQEFGARPTDIHSPTSSVNDLDFEVKTKTGYLTKRGDRFKSWKNRWFVVEKQWMRYYTNKGSADPKGVIDLSTALECSDDDSFSNGFRIVLPKRVYFIQASREEERESWVKLVKWKLAYYNPSLKDTR